jgi:hypothetical protein
MGETGMKLMEVHELILHKCTVVKNTFNEGSYMPSKNIIHFHTKDAHTYLTLSKVVNLKQL